MIGGVSIGILEKLLGQVSIVRGVCAEPGADREVVLADRAGPDEADSHAGGCLSSQDCSVSLTMVIRL